MTYDGLVLAAVIAELKRAIEGGRIQNIRQHNDTDLTLEIRSKGRQHLLFMSVSARFARVYLTASVLPVPQTPPNFCALLRKHVRGTFITAVEQAGFDRVLRIRTGAPDGNGNVLVLELMGKHSNLILLSDAGRILGAAKHVTAAVSRYRQVLPGREYLPPPGAGKANPVEVTRAEFDGLWRGGFEQEPSPEDAKRWLIASFSGIGPFLAEEVLLAAGSAGCDPIWAALQELAAVVRSQDYSPRLITDDLGKAVYAYPIPTHQLPSANQYERRSMGETLDTLFRDLLSRDEFDSERAALEAAIRRSLASREQTQRRLAEALAEGEKADRYKHFGELILAGATGIRKGQQSAWLTDYYAPDLREVEIPLDEKLSPRENAERYFRRYRKAREGAQVAADRTVDLRTESRILQAAMDRLPSAASAENIRALRKMLAARGLLRPEPRPPVPGRRGEPEFGAAKIRRVMSAAGMEMLYGENSESNDYLTMKVARPNDLWFHARSVTGAHVVIRTGNRPEAVPQHAIHEAAQIAARNSEARHSSLVPVDYTLKKHVRKPRASPPGFVTYTREKTIDVAPQAR